MGSILVVFSKIGKYRESYVERIIGVVAYDEKVPILLCVRREMRVLFLALDVTKMWLKFKWKLNLILHVMISIIA